MSKQRVNSLLHPDFDSFAYNLAFEDTDLSLSPEKKLLLAVIVQAVDDATNPNAKPRDKKAARDVIFSSHPTELKGMCNILGIDYDYFRRAVTRMIETGRTINRKIIYD